MTVEERLARIEANTDRILRALDGNGQPGIIVKTAQLQEQVDSLEMGLKEIKEQKTRSGLAGGIAGGSLASIGGLVAFVLDKLGIINIA